MFVPVLAFGADLGRLTLLSGVGEPLRAEIEILSVQANEATSLAARIPPPDVFWRANLEPPPFIDQFRASVERRPKGRYVVTLSSTKPVENPFIQILVQLDSVAGLGDHSHDARPASDYGACGDSFRDSSEARN